MTDIPSQRLSPLYRQEIIESIEALKGLSKDGLHNIPKITWWTLHYEELYNYCYANRNNQSCFGNFGCGCSWDTEEYKFTNLYHGLKEIVELHQHENYFKKELANINKLQSNSPAIIKLLKKNEKIGTEDFFLFWFEWLDEENNTVRPWIMNWNDLNIIFSREEWKHTINFLKTFNQLYWDSDLVSKSEFSRCKQ